MAHPLEFASRSEIVEAILYLESVHALLDLSEGLITAKVCRHDGVRERCVAVQGYSIIEAAALLKERFGELPAALGLVTRGPDLDATFDCDIVPVAAGE